MGPVSKLNIADLFNWTTKASLQQVAYAPTKGTIIKKQTTHVPLLLMFDDQKTLVRQQRFLVNDVL
jgi:hypothetical protein